MAGSICEISSEMGDNHGNFDLFRLDSVFAYESTLQHFLGMKIIRQTFTIGQNTLYNIF